MLFAIEMLIWGSGGLNSYPAAEYNGQAVRQILEDIPGKHLVIKVHQGMLGDYYICGSEEAAEGIRTKNRKILSPQAIMNLWNGSPLLELIWPISPPNIKEAA